MTKNICNDKKGTDKLLHLSCEFLIASLVGMLLTVVTFSTAWTPAAIAFVTGMAAGIWKECRDRRKSGNHFCVWDLVWDAGGSALGAGYAFILHYNL